MAELQFSEQRARAFMDNSEIIAWLKDEQGRNVFLSDNYVRRFGLKDWHNKTDFELWPRDVAELFQKSDLETLRRERPFECVEEPRTPGGEVSCWLNSKFWFQDAAGKKFVGGVGVDITERRQAETALREAQRKLLLHGGLGTESRGTHRQASGNGERASARFLRHRP